MGSKATRSVFAAALCAGVAMLGASVNGLMDVDAELQRSAIAARQQAPDHTFRVLYRPDGGGCGERPAIRDSSHQL